MSRIVDAAKFMNSLVFILSFLSSTFPLSFSSTITSLNSGHSLSSQDFLISSPHGIFTAGFFSIGENAYCFSIWFSDKYDDVSTVVWMANRDQPVNGKYSRLAVEKNGNIVLTDAGLITVWTSNTHSNSSVELHLLDSGNLVLRNKKGDVLWQSFDYPTTTLLPRQLFTHEMTLVSSRSPTNYSSGFYKLFFDNDNVLKRRYEGPEITSVFWPDPWLVSYEAGRSAYNTSKVAVLDSSGHFLSSDHLDFNTSDYGIGPQRRLTLDVDGNLRVYSADKAKKRWYISWVASLAPCKIHGICGVNSLCVYTLSLGRKCSCIPGYKMKNRTDWTSGCEPEFRKSCKDNKTDVFVQVPHVEFYGYDIGYYKNYTWDMCKKLCLQYCDCKGFQFKFESDNGYYVCLPKTLLFNGYQSSGFDYPMYIRLPKSKLTTNLENNPLVTSNLECNRGHITRLDRSYERKQNHQWVKSFLWCTCAVGAFEISCLLVYFYATRKRSNATLQGYIQVATGFRRFSYEELKKATRNFKEEIGRGGGGVVYKGMLSDNRIAAIKVLKDARQGEAEFLAEVSIIGRLNHMNLLDTWGYCAEGKHRLLVYDYMERGSLAENLASNNLDWNMRYEVAVGTAKGLNYLHEECLEWVLHCDVKPQNILLDKNNQAKLADFGLSKLFLRSGPEREDSSFSRIRGTRGYMAPEWVFNLPITSKVDVYSYGVVVMEIITGKGPIFGHGQGSNIEDEPRRLVTWVREKMENQEIHDIVDPALNGEYDEEKMKVLIKLAIKCMQEEKDSRPSMSEVVNTLLLSETAQSNIF